MKKHWLAGAVLLWITLLFNLPIWAAVPGPIKVSSNGRYFIDNQGKPFFWLGDTAWPIFFQYSRQQADGYFKNRGDRGFTVIQCVLAWGDDRSDSWLSPMANQAGEKPWSNNDPATPNDKFFQNVDYMVESANQRGLILAILPNWGSFVNVSHLINFKNARAYGRWLGQRYKNAPNVVWVTGGDHMATGFEEVYREQAMGLREGDGGAHLITYHPCGARSSSDYFQNESWLDFNMIETWGEWAKVYPAVQGDFGRTPIRPVVLGEGAYENGPEYPQGPITPLLVRRQAWWAFMAGGFFTYGQDQIWRAHPGWEKTFDTPGAVQMGKMKEILSSFNWWEMVPDQWVFDSGTGSEKTLNAAMRTLKGDRVLIYLSSQCTVFVPLDKITSRELKATWINPQTGKRLDAGSYLTGNLNGKEYPGGGTQFFKTPDFWEDALLMLEPK